MPYFKRNVCAKVLRGTDGNIIAPKNGSNSGIGAIPGNGSNSDVWRVFRVAIDFVPETPGYRVEV